MENWSNWKVMIKQLENKLKRIQQRKRHMMNNFGRKKKGEWKFNPYVHLE